MKQDADRKDYSLFNMQKKKKVKPQKPDEKVLIDFALSLLICDQLSFHNNPLWVCTCGSAPTKPRGKVFSAAR